jgi:hypothetical protein
MKSNLSICVEPIYNRSQAPSQIFDFEALGGNGTEKGPL